jgi:hypothetical protein
MIIPISASQVATITDMNYRCPAKIKFLKQNKIPHSYLILETFKKKQREGTPQILILKY